MKSISLFLTALSFMLMTNHTAFAAEPSKSAKRIAYTLKNLKLNEQQAKALQPILTQYLSEMKVAKKAYKELEDKYKRDIDNGTLTDKAASALLTAKFDCDGKELAVKKKFLPKFQATIPAKKVFLLYDFINDKMSKIDAAMGGRSSKNDTDDED